MAAILSANEFSKHVNTDFRATLGADTQTDLELVEVKVYTSKHEEQSGMERFSIYFTGPADPLLPQKLYAIQHDEMGEFEMFLVPLSRNEEGSRYEAVFNYFKKTE